MVACQNNHCYRQVAKSRHHNNTIPWAILWHNAHLRVLKNTQKESWIRIQRQMIRWIPKFNPFYRDWCLCVCEVWRAPLNCKWQGMNRQTHKQCDKQTNLTDQHASQNFHFMKFRVTINKMWVFLTCIVLLYLIVQLYVAVDINGVIRIGMLLCYVSVQSSVGRKPWRYAGNMLTASQ